MKPLTNPPLCPHFRFGVPNLLSLLFNLLHFSISLTSSLAIYQVLDFSRYEIHPKGKALCLPPQSYALTSNGITQAHIRRLICFFCDEQTKMTWEHLTLLPPYLLSQDMCESELIRIRLKPRFRDAPCYQYIPPPRWETYGISTQLVNTAHTFSHKKKKCMNKNILLWLLVIKSW